MVESRSIFTLQSANIQAGDTVIVYHSRDNLSAIVVTPGQRLTSKYGEFPHQDMIGIRFGSKCASRKGNGFTYLLRPTPELWTLALPHRTQILYHPDISFITSQLDIKPGSTVIEAGTGSGSFSHSIARTIGPTGRLFSFEFHEERHSKAAAEFKAHGLLSSVGGPIRLAHRNVIRDGFGDLGGAAERSTADSVFLDLPAPWDALEDAMRVMNRAQVSRVCCFSPCIEQVQKTCQTLASLGFADIAMFETLVRTHEPVTVALPTVDDAVRRIKEVEQRKHARRARQISEAKMRKQAAEERAAAATDGPSADAPVDATGEKRKSLDDPVAADGPLPKKPRTAMEGEEDERMADAVDQPGSPHTLVPRSGSAANTVESGKPAAMEQDEERLGQSTACPPAPVQAPAPPTIETCRPAGMSRGHTSFLTFAVLLPLPAPCPSEPVLSEPVL